MLGRYTTGPGCLVGSRILPYPVLSKPSDPFRWPLWKHLTGQLAFLHALLTAGRTVGPRVHDARIVALCRQHGVRELWSADRDFNRFAGLSVVNPLVTT